MRLVGHLLGSAIAVLLLGDRVHHGRRGRRPAHEGLGGRPQALVLPDADDEEEDEHDEEDPRVEDGVDDVYILGRGDRRAGLEEKQGGNDQGVQPANEVEDGGDEQDDRRLQRW